LAAGEGNIIKNFKIGSTQIKICDDYCRDTTSEAVKAILDHIAFRTQEQLAIQARIQPNKDQTRVHNACET